MRSRIVYKHCSRHSIILCRSVAPRPTRKRERQSQKRPADASGGAASVPATSPQTQAQFPTHTPQLCCLHVMYACAATPTLRLKAWKCRHDSACPLLTTSGQNRILVVPPWPDLADTAPDRRSPVRSLEQCMLGQGHSEDCLHSRGALCHRHPAPLSAMD